MKSPKKISNSWCFFNVIIKKNTIRKKPVIKQELKLKLSNNKKYKIQRSRSGKIYTKKLTSKPLDLYYIIIKKSYKRQKN